MLSPLKNNVIVELIEKEKVTSSGIVLASADPTEVNRGKVLAIGPEVEDVQVGDEVYEGMVVGENNRDNDLVVNVTREKHLTNIRAAGSDENIILTPPLDYTLEQALEFIEDDELVEVTPQSIRLRKKFLTENERKRAGKV